MEHSPSQRRGWEKLLALVQEGGVTLHMVFLDGTNIRAHQKAAGASRKVDLQPAETAVKRLAPHPWRVEGLVAAMVARPA